MEHQSKILSIIDRIFTLYNFKKLSKTFKKHLTNHFICDIICKYDERAPLAQKVEHMTFNHGVRSSTLRWSTKSEIQMKSRIIFFIFHLSFFPKRAEALSLLSVRNKKPVAFTSFYPAPVLFQKTAYGQLLSPWAVFCFFSFALLFYSISCHPPQSKPRHRRFYSCRV